MPNDNVEIVWTVLGASNRDEQETILDFLDPEIVFDASRRQPTAHLFTVEAGRVVRWELGHTDSDAFDAAGLRE